jgi:hypothetical protein
MFYKIQLIKLIISKYNEDGMYTFDDLLEVDTDYLEFIIGE